MLIACKILGVRCGWVPPSPLSTERRILPELGTTSEPSGVAKTLASIEHSGTHESYVNLISGKADFLLVARPPSDDELRSARSARVKLEVTVVALDAFVFLVNARNPVDDLTIDQVRGIYTGAITDWAEVGGTAGQIKAYQRDRNSGSQELMEALVMKGTRMIEAPDMIMETMAGPINAVGRDPQGIGYSVYYYATVMLPDSKVKLVGVGGAMPTSETIGRRTYPLVAEVYAALRGGMPRDSTAVMLRDWLLTTDGQAVVVESGYVTAR